MKGSFFGLFLIVLSLTLIFSSSVQYNAEISTLFVHLMVILSHVCVFTHFDLDLQSQKLPWSKQFSCYKSPYTY